MKKNRRFTIMFLCFVLVFITNFGVHAKEDHKTEKVMDEYYTEIRDPQILLDKYILLCKEKLSISTDDNRFSVDLDSNDITVTQLLMKSTSREGDEIRYYSTSRLLLTDENNNLLTKEQIMGMATVHSGSSVVYGGHYNVAVMLTAYWQWQMVNMVQLVRCTSTTSQIVNNNTGTYRVTELKNSFYKAADITEHDDAPDAMVTFTNPNGYTSYTAVNPNQNFVSMALYFSMYYVGVQITYNTGAVEDISINIKQECQYDGE